MTASNDYNIVWAVRLVSLMWFQVTRRTWTYRSVLATVANVLGKRPIRLKDRTRGAWPQSKRARIGAVRFMLGKDVEWKVYKGAFKKSRRWNAEVSTFAERGHVAELLTALTSAWVPPRS